MWDIVSTSDKSKYQMIEHLYGKTSPTTIPNLSKKTSVSVRSIKYNLSEMKEEIHALEGKLITSSEGVLLDLPPNIGLDYFQREIFKQTLGFRLLEKLFFKDQVTRYEMIEELYISVSSFNRLILKLNTVLKKYGLKIHTSPLSITGDEAMLREFFTVYFQEAYSVNEWPFNNINPDNIERIMAQFIERYQLNSTSLNYNEYQVYLAVSITRRLNGHSVEPLYIVEGKTVDTCLKKTVDALNLFPREKDIYLEEFTPLDQYLSIIYSTENSSEKENLTNHVQDIKDIVNQLINQFNLPEDIVPSILYLVEIDVTLVRYAVLGKEGLDYHYLLFKPRDYFVVDFYKEHYTAFYQRLYSELNALCQNRGFSLNESAIQDIMYFFITKWTNLTYHMVSQFSYCKLLLYSHINNTNAETIENEIRNRLNGFVEIEIFDGRLMNEERIKDYDFDILLTTVTLSIKIDQPVYFLHREKYDLNLNKLDEMIKSVIDENIKSQFDEFIRI